MAAEVSFANMKVPDLWKSLKGRDIQISINGKNRKRAELLQNLKRRQCKATS